ncbi:hypothetical protein Ciccas_003172 [Cichlidogyrus casuarinus]|uniref:Uncharacterized protein n=1 Tax=Cichlidogyrus casuarinus TaxID=1844966 RepID=A0ABD2QF42_9PLAT
MTNRKNDEDSKSKKCDDLEKQLKALKEGHASLSARLERMDKCVVDTALEMRDMQVRLDTLSGPLNCDLRNPDEMKTRELVEGLVRKGMESWLCEERKDHLMVYGFPIQPKEFKVLKAACAKAGYPQLYSATRFGKQKKDAQGNVLARPLRLTFSDLITRQCLARTNATLKVNGVTYKLVREKKTDEN